MSRIILFIVCAAVVGIIYSVSHPNYQPTTTTSANITSENVTVTTQNTTTNKFSEIVLPYRGGISSLKGTKLINNRDAIDVDYKTLVNFIQSDNTDQNDYLADVYVCMDFARDVHNNAEKHGIKCGIVIIDFIAADNSTDMPGHACNVFNTTDKGQVFIDCVGEDVYARIGRRINGYQSTVKSRDKIAYTMIGKPFGLIPINKAEDLSYDYYLQYQYLIQQIDKLSMAYKILKADNSYNVRLKADEALKLRNEILTLIGGFYYVEDSNSYVSKMQIFW